MKKVLASLAIVALLAGSVSVAGCGKYEEGPSISLRTKKARLVGDWKIVKVEVNGTDQTNSQLALVTDQNFKFEKDGKYSFAITTNVPIIGLVNTTRSGSWEFVSDKEEIKITEVDGNTSSSTTSTILRLTNKEFWMKNVSGNNTTITHYEAK
ncbi:MAG: DUF5004 domain-containing protein [Bacteroidetes bacterium]|nr:DUF5004 domain-containing protein [Bacteroidota bacterium]